MLPAAERQGGAHLFYDSSLFPFGALATPITLAPATGETLPVVSPFKRPLDPLADCISRGSVIWNHPFVAFN